jgi:hypothetical protein
MWNCSLVYASLDPLIVVVVLCDWDWFFSHYVGYIETKFLIPFMCGIENQNSANLLLKTETRGLFIKLKTHPTLIYLIHGSYKF